MEIPDSLRSMTRRQVRYQLYRLRNEAEGGAKAEPPEGLKAYYESLAGFRGWVEFARAWDIAGEYPYAIRYRQFSVEEEWNATLRRIVPVVPGLGHMENRIGDGGESDL